MIAFESVEPLRVRAVPVSKYLSAYDIRFAPHSIGEAIRNPNRRNSLCPSKLNYNRI